MTLLVSWRPPKAAIFEMDIIKRPRKPVMPINEKRTLVTMAMATKDEIHSVIFQNRHDVFAHQHEVAASVKGIVRIMGSFRVGRAMPQRDEPIFVVAG